MDMSKVLIFISFLQILMLKGISRAKGVASCSSHLGDVISDPGGGCDVRIADNRTTLTFTAGENATLKCSITTTGSSLYWSKGDERIVQNLNSSSVKYAVRTLPKSDSVVCFRGLYILEFLTDTDDSGFYSCGCENSNTSRWDQRFRVTVKNALDTESLIGGVIIVLTLIFVGIFQFASFIALIVQCIQKRRGHRFKRPRSLVVIIMFELIILPALVAIYVLQWLKVIPACCKGNTSELYVKFIGIGVGLFVCGVIVIILTVVITWKITRTNVKRRSTNAREEHVQLQDPCPPTQPARQQPQPAAQRTQPTTAQPVQQPQAAAQRTQPTTAQPAQQPQAAAQRTQPTTAQPVQQPSAPPIGQEPGSPQESQRYEPGIETMVAAVSLEILAAIMENQTVQHVGQQPTQQPPLMTSSATPSAGANNMPASPPEDHEPLPGQVCCICLDRPVQTCFPQCGHTNLCYACARTMIESRGRCPICNGAVSSLSVLYT